MNIDFIEMRTVVVITKTVGGCVNIILYSFSNISIPTKQSQRSVITESGTSCRKKRMQPLHNRKAGTRIQSYVRLPAHACHAKSSLHGNEALPCHRSLPSNPAGNKLRRRLPIVLYRFYSYKSDDSDGILPTRSLRLSLSAEQILPDPSGNACPQLPFPADRSYSRLLFRHLHSPPCSGL